MNVIFSGKLRKNKRTRAAAFSLLASVAVAVLVACLLSPASHAAPQRDEGTWTDSFDSTASNSGVKELQGTRVAGGSLKLAETVPNVPGDPGDLGVPVPGESGVYAVLNTGLGPSGCNIYCGTGEKGHLIEHDPTQLFQEKYEGPSHLGVSNSRGQAVPPDSSATPSRVTALATDGTLVYGGTYPDGRLFSFEPDDGSGNPTHRACVDLGATPGGGSVMALAWDGAVLYGGTSEGHLFSYDGSFTDLGTPPGGGAVNALSYDGATLFGGTENGHLFSYDGSFADLGMPPGGGAINALTAGGGVTYGGTESGYVFLYDGLFTDLGRPSGAGEPVNSVALTGTTLYSGSENGHVYCGTPGSHQDMGEPAGCDGSPVNALSIAADGRLYGGTGSDTEGREGHLFCMSGYEDHGALGSGVIEGVTYTSGWLFFVDDGNNLYTYPEPGTFTLLGSPEGGTVTNDLESSMGRVYFGMENGELSLYDTGTDNEPFTGFGAPEPDNVAPITSIIPLEGIGGAIGTTVFTGLEDGRLYSGEISSAQPPSCEFSELLATTGTGEAILDLAWIGSDSNTLYLAGDEGHLYSYADSLINDLGSVGSAINSITVSNGIIYLALDSGDLYSYDPLSPSFVYLGGSPGGSPLKCIARGDQGVIAGAENGSLYMFNQWVPSGSLWDLGNVPDLGMVETLHEVNDYVWGGTGNGGLFCYDNAFLADRGQQVRKQDNIWCMAYDPNQQLFYAGTFNAAHFLVIDPATNTVIDRGRPVDGEREVEDIIIASDGTVYGSTYAGTLDIHNPAGGRMFTYDPSTGDFSDIGKPPTSEEWWITSLVEGPEPDRLIYGATSWSLGAPTGGRLFSYDPSGGTWDDLGNPMDGTGYDEGTRCMVLSNDSHIYGGTWDPVNWGQGHIYCYEIGTGTVLVEEIPGGYRKYANHLIELGGDIYGAQENGYVFSFEPDPGGIEPAILGEPVKNAQSVNSVSPAQGQTLMFGNGGKPGHVVNYDPDCGFRDVGIPLEECQDKVSALAFSTDSNVMIGGTYGKSESGTILPARLFRVDPYIAGEEKSALSAGVFPAVDDLGAPVPGHDEIGALCPAPDDKKIVWGGTANPGTDGSDARIFKYDTMTGGFTDMDAAIPGHKKILSLCRSSDGCIYGGTGNESDGPDARLFSIDPNTGEATDLGIPLAGAKGIYSLTVGDNGRVYIGTGDKGFPESGEPGHLVEYDPVEETFSDHGAIMTTGRARVTTLITGSNGLIYGGTGEYPGKTYIATLFSYNPSTGSFPRKFTISAIGERTIHSLVEMPDGRIYGGTGPAGKIFSCDLSLGTLQAEVTLPYDGDTPLYSMAAADGGIYGCAGDKGMLFKFESGSVLEMGPVTYFNEGAKAGVTDNLGKPCFGTSGDAEFVRVDPELKFRWGQVTYTRTPEAPVPAGQEAYIDVLDSTGTVTLESDVSSGTDLSLTSAAGQEGLHLQGRLKTGNTAISPEIEQWGLEWRGLPNINAIEPGKAYPGDEIQIWGSSFGETPDEVDVGGVTVSGILPEDWNDNFIKVKVPESASSGEVVVRAGLDQSEPEQFTLYTQPSITGIDPAGAYVGETVEIEGLGFIDSRGDSFISFNGTEGTDYTLWSDNLITVTVPDGATAGNLVVNVRGIDSNPVDFTVIEDPQLTGIDPDEACAGEAVTIDGSWFLDTRGGSTVMFGTVPAVEYVSWSNDSIDVKVPQGAHTGDVTVVVNGRESNSVEFTVLDRFTARIDSPVNGVEASGTVDIKASASGGSGVAGVDFLIDGDVVGSDTSAPYGFQWDTTGISDGQHAVGVTAYDNSGRTASDGISVVVDNYAPVPTISKYWYFAEGCTDYGFETWVLIANPGDRVVNAAVEFMDDAGRTVNRNYRLPPDSRTTINVAGEVGQANVSTKITSDNEVVCERTMFWNNRVEGHTSIGTTMLSRDWYFAEGCSDYGFETYVLLGNPGDEPVDVTLDYMLENGEVRSTSHELDAHSRKTVNAVEEIGAGEFSIRARSDVPGIVAERAMYYGGRRCGTGTIGCTEPSTSWYLSEGSTDWGFETWILLQCPGDENARVNVTYQKSTGEQVRKTYNVTGKSRYTIDLSSEVGTADASTVVESDRPVVCERAMYWNRRSAGHCTIGSPELGTQWYLAEGCSDYGFETWVLLNNPSGRPVDAVLTFLKDDGSAVPVGVNVPAYSRASINAADFVPNSSFSTRVQAPSPVMMERAMYWNNRQGGTGSIGAK